MTKAELEQYRSIVAEIDEIQKKIDTHLVSGIVTGSDREFPYTRRTFSYGGVEKYGDAQRYLIQKRNLELQKQAIEHFIDEIPDSVTRRIFRYRYIDGTVKPSWQWIAFKIGYTDEQIPRKKHNKFLKSTKSTKIPC